ncbi:MAG: TlpA disulfide reductase family protein [Solirubrobacteraceae bacterium]
MKRRIVPVITIVVAGALIAVLAYGLSAQGASRALDSALAAGKRPAAPEVARKLPVLNRVDAASASLSHWRGQVVVINFWASWCNTCDAESGLLEHAQRLLVAEHEGTIIGITYKDISSDSLASVKQYGFTFPNLRDVDGSFAEGYGTAQLPETFVLDRQLHVVAISRGEITTLSWLMNAIHAAAQA